MPARGSALVDSWNRWWFPAGHGVDLAICRIWVVATLLVFFLPPLDVHRSYAIYNAGTIRAAGLVTWLGSWLGPVTTESFVTLAYVVTLSAGVLTILGLLTRLSTALLALGYLFLVTHGYSYGESHHPPTLTAIFLLILPFTNCGHRLSIDAWLRRRRRPAASDPDETLYAWPLKLMQLVIGLVYLNSAWWKLVNSGLGWVAGATLQRDLLWMGLNQDWPPALWAGQQTLLLPLIATGTLLFEAGFISAVFIRRLTPYWLVAGVGFHFGMIALRRGDPAFLAWVVLYATFIDFEALGRRLGLRRR